MRALVREITTPPVRKPPNVARGTPNVLLDHHRVCRGEHESLWLVRMLREEDGSGNSSATRVKCREKVCVEAELR